MLKLFSFYRTINYKCNKLMTIIMELFACFPRVRSLNMVIDNFCDYSCPTAETDPAPLASQPVTHPPHYGGCHDPIYIYVIQGHTQLYPPNCFINCFTKPYPFHSHPCTYPSFPQQKVNELAKKLVLFLFKTGRNHCQSILRPELMLRRPQRRNEIVNLNIVPETAGSFRY